MFSFLCFVSIIASFKTASKVDIFQNNKQCLVASQKGQENG